MSTTDPKKIAFRGTTNRDLQKHIDSYFTTLGGINPEGLNYTSSNYYYFIDNSGEIIRVTKLPVGYTEREPGDYFKDSLGGIKNKRKFAFLGSEYPEIQEAMINFFVKLGATNRLKLLCRYKDMYYFIDETNNIDNSLILPEGYIFQLHTYLNVMKNQEDKIPEYVECIESKEDSFTVGKIYIWPAPVCNKGITRSISVTCLEGMLWSFKPSTKEAYEAQNTYFKAAEYTPQVGDYVIMEKAGGWGYHPDNNGCLAIVNRIGKIRVSEGEVFTIYGDVINPNKDITVKFSNIPQFGHGKEVIFRKALPHEIPDVPESPLEICRKKYKKGMLVRSAKEYGEYSGEFIIDVDPSEFYYTGSGVDYFASRGWLYINGKFADILGTPKESLTRGSLEFHAEMERKFILDKIKQNPLTPKEVFSIKAAEKQIKKNKFQEVHEIKTVEEKLLKKTKSKLFNI